VKIQKYIENLKKIHKIQTIITKNFLKYASSINKMEVDNSRSINENINHIVDELKRSYQHK
jgi:hypothetical protein